MKKTLIVTAALLSVIFITSNAFSWGRGGYGRGCNGGGYGYNSGSAVLPELTQEQKTQLADLRQKFIDETYETRSAMQNKRHNLRMLLETSSPDKAKLTQLSNEMIDLKKEMQTKRIEFILAAKEIAPGLNVDSFRFFGRGFGMGRHFGKGFGGNGPCRGFGSGATTGMGYGNGPCTWTQETDQ